MKDLSSDELKELIVDSYELIVELPLERNERRQANGQTVQIYSIKSRNKIKNLAESLREMDDPGAAIPHFIKNAAYSLPRADRGGLDDSKFLTFLDRLIEKVNTLIRSEKDYERRRKKIQYLIGYTNWGADSLCTIFSASETEEEAKHHVSAMIQAEFLVLDTLSIPQKFTVLVEKIMKWGNEAETSRRQ